MGSAIAERLLECGHELVVWNRTPSKAAPLVALGARAAETPKNLAESVDTIITILTDEAALERVYRAIDGILATDVQDRLIIDMSTVTPQAEEALAQHLRIKGAAFMECPVAGTVGPARSGKLLGLAGGNKEDVARAIPLLSQLCRRVEHIGDVGAAASLKLAINLPLLVFFQAFGEAYSLINDLGHSPTWLVEMMAETAGAANVLRMRSAVVANALRGDLSEPPAFDIRTAHKDLRVIIDYAASKHQTLPITERTFAVYDTATQEGWGERDLATFPAYWGALLSHLPASA
jgi:3-hydroxyisobutyrate dehydrogenase